MTSKSGEFATLNRRSCIREGQQKTAPKSLAVFIPELESLQEAKWSGTQFVGRV